MEFYYLIILFVFQRLSEVHKGNGNLKLHESELAIPLDNDEKKQMFSLHALWFISLIFEFYLHGQVIAFLPFIIGILILAACQIIRYQTMRILGSYWVHYPVVFKNQMIKAEGAYRYIKHPNYLVVIIEVALLPLLGRCYWTAGFFSIINFVFIIRRMKIEEEALEKFAQYGSNKMKKKLIPYVFLLLLIPGLSFAKTINFNAREFEEAKNGPTYFMFKGESTKFGMVTTSFEGYAKSGRLEYQEEPGSFSQVVLTLDAKKIDTDNSSRDEKMHDKCLEVKKHPEIQVRLEKISQLKAHQVVEGIMFVREKKVPLKITIKKKDENTFTGNTSFKLSQADIPDPSIAIASVKDKFKIKFQLRLEK